jgi:hypothetical protein
MGAWRACGVVMRRIAAAVMVLALAGCGAQASATPTPVPLPSVPAAERERADAALDAFLAAMADPDVTYRANGILRVGSVDENDRPDILVNTRYDVKGDGYGGRLDIHLRDPNVGGDYQILVNDESAELWTSRTSETASIDAPDTLRRPDTLRDLTAEDLSFLGVTDEGLLEFVVTPWLGGDPLGEWVDLGAVPDGAMPHTAVRWHDSRLYIDDAGTPHRLAQTWSFLTEETDEESEGTIVEEFEGLGMYVTLDATPDGLVTTSHDTDVGPYREITPAGGDTATVDLEVTSDGPVMLGIEGAIYFVRSHDGDGDVVADRIVGFDLEPVEIGAGEQTLVAYYRTCNGNCAALDGARDFCEVAAEIEDGGRYVLTVEILGMQRAHPANCTIAEVNG